MKLFFILLMITTPLFSSSFTVFTEPTEEDRKFLNGKILLLNNTVATAKRIDPNIPSPNFGEVFDFQDLFLDLLSLDDSCIIDQEKSSDNKTHNRTLLEIKSIIWQIFLFCPRFSEAVASLKMLEKMNLNEDHKRIVATTLEAHEFRIIKANAITIFKSMGKNAEALEVVQLDTSRALQEIIFSVLDEVRDPKWLGEMDTYGFYSLLNLTTTDGRREYFNKLCEKRIGHFYAGIENITAFIINRHKNDFVRVRRFFYLKLQDSFTHEVLGPLSMAENWKGLMARFRELIDIADVEQLKALEELGKNYVTFPQEAEISTQIKKRRYFLSVKRKALLIMGHWKDSSVLSSVRLAKNFQELANAMGNIQTTHCSLAFLKLQDLYSRLFGFYSMDIQQDIHQLECKEDLNLIKRDIRGILKTFPKEKILAVFDAQNIEMLRTSLDNLIAGSEKMELSALKRASTFVPGAEKLSAKIEEILARDK